jgi:PhzF family phenazine biosynthesis protein
MEKFKLFQVDAFAEKLFTGNPAAVCILNKWLSDELMQSIAAENNLAETAFVVPKNKDFEIRWFTPTVEVELCGHATLASAFVMYNHLNYAGIEINFYSKVSGVLKVIKQENIFFLDFPTDNLYTNSEFDYLNECIGTRPIEIYKGKTDYIAVLETEEQVFSIIPDFNKISKLDSRGLIITSKGKNVDFVSRFFAPQSGINEDPVTGSAHTSLIPLWSKKLGKIDMVARQISKRGGKLICSYRDERCLIGGEAKLYMEGEIYVE